MRLRLNSIMAYVLIIGSAALAVGCKSNNQSSATGWEINDRKSGGFQANLDYQEQETGPGLVFVEGGTFTMGRVQDDFMYDWNNSPTVQHVRSFYMDETEVTNVMYQEYLYWLKRVFPTDNEQYKYIFESALPDTLVWRERLAANEDLVVNYLRHPAYRNYPVVGVSWLQATQFCDWRTDRVNERILIDKGIMNDVNGSQDKIVEGADHFDTETYLIDPSEVFKDKDAEVYRKGLPDYSPDQENKGEFEGRHVRNEDGIILPKYRLPTEAEWEYAALGLPGNREFNNIRGRKKYPWNGKTPGSEKKRDQGELLANYKKNRGDYDGLAGWSNDGADITNEVKSYPPNDFGLYDMAGNVAEWVADVYRPVVDNEANDFNYFRGNVFTKFKRDEYGKIVSIADSIPYDTLANGQLFPTKLPGSIAKVDVTEEDTYMRSNYTQANNINYRDGDKNSSIGFNEPDLDLKMYDSPENTIELDGEGNIVNRKYDEAIRTSMINDRVRVYKGGSWKDRAYWLSPGQRRFMQQDLSSNYIGFRCAMDRLGSKSKHGKRPYH